MNISDLNQAAKQIAIKKALIEVDPILSKCEAMHYENKKLFFDTPEGTVFITVPNHGTPLLGFECSKNIWYQCLMDRHQDKLKLLLSLNSEPK